MGTLKTIDTINVATQYGPCVVELLSGDITSIKKKVDYIMVSAFPGDYSIVPGTVIWALHKAFGIKVRRLAQDKELDLRKHFSIWVSRPIELYPEFKDCPYKRLICFEKQYSNMATHPGSLVGDVFRGLTAVVNNQDTSIITPLLATGNQRYSPSTMIKTIVHSACNWMKNGLPLRSLKIVIYPENGKNLSKDQKDVVDVFSSMKLDWGKSSSTVVNEIEYDIYLSYNPVDLSIAEMISGRLVTIVSAVKIFNKHQTLVAESAWQEDMFETMIASRRIVYVLTNSFMESKECLEQFNIGMCCSRQRGFDILIPLYCDDIPSVPSYIMLVQYIDCRPSATQQSLDSAITLATSRIVKSLKSNSSHSDDQYDYDVFISYSHKQPNEARILSHYILTTFPTIKVFQDLYGLQAGYRWQKTLYTALDRCTCVVAMLCDEYLSSPVCMEELFISMAKAAEKNSCLFPVMVTDITSVPDWLKRLHLIDCRKNASEVMKLVGTAIDKYLTTKHEKGSKFQTNAPYLLLEGVHEKLRANRSDLRIEKDDCRYLADCEKSQNCHVYFCYTPDDAMFAAILGHMIKEKFADVQTSYGNDSATDRLQKLDEASVIVLFLSQTFTESTQLMDEFYHMIFRCRRCEHKLLYVILTSALPVNPIFLHLLCVDTYIIDTKRSELVHSTDDVATKFIITGALAGSYRCSNDNSVALREASEYIISMLSNKIMMANTVGGQSIFINVMESESVNISEHISLLKELPVTRLSECIDDQSRGDCLDEASRGSPVARGDRDVGLSQHQTSTKVNNKLCSIL